MNDSTADNIERLSARLVDLEMRFTHLERMMADMNHVVLAQSKQLEALERTLSALGAELRVVSGSIVEERKPEDEKPPHY